MVDQFWVCQVFGVFTKPAFSREFVNLGILFFLTLYSALRSSKVMVTLERRVGSSRSQSGHFNSPEHLNHTYNRRIPPSKNQENLA